MQSGVSVVKPARRRIAARRLTAAAVVVLLAACNGQGGMSNETVGTVAGAAVGGLAGSFIGTGSTRVLATLGGAAIGGLIGNRIGQALDERDREALAEQSRRAIASSADNAPVAWKSDHSGSTATVVANNTHNETRTVPVARETTVAPPVNLVPIGVVYRARVAEDIRLAPNPSSTRAGGLAVGERINAIGKVAGGGWIMVARGGRAVGYVPAAGMEPAPPGAPAQGQPAGFDLDTQAPVRSAADLDALPPGTTVDRVNANVTCRDIKLTVESRGEASTSKQSACKSPDGTWDLS